MGCQLLFVPAVFSQSLQISGRVVDAADETPLPFANVFISNTTRGTTTGLDGTFRLTNVSPGQVNLVVSYVGYETQTFLFDIEEDVALTNAIRMPSAGHGLAEVEVKEKRDRKWERKLDRFQQIFLGESEFSRHCSIVNPWVLEFIEGPGGKDSFSATASAPLNIRNEALGYRLTYHLRLFTASQKSVFFTGSAHFEEMDARDDEQAELWSKNRMVAYLGSTRHLFQAILFNDILPGQLLEEGFLIYKDKPGYENYAVRSSLFSAENGVTIEPVDTGDLVGPSYQTGLYRIRLGGRIEVHYNRTLGKPANMIYKDLPFEVSWVEIKAAFVDVTKDGIHQRPDQLVVSGAMLEGRVAKMLPHDFAPAGHKF